MLFSAHEIPYGADEELINGGQLEAPENYSYLKIFWNFFCKMNSSLYYILIRRKKKRKHQQNYVYKLETG